MLVLILAAWPQTQKKVEGGYKLNGSKDMDNKRTRG